MENGKKNRKSSTAQEIKKIPWMETASENLNFET
jgi:hypothetical protein